MGGPLQTHWRRALRWLGWAVCTGCFAAAALLCARAPSPPSAALSPERAEGVAAGIARREPGMRRASEREFLGDRWSQDDSFHNQEQGLLRGAAARERVNLGSVIDALDHYLRTHPSPQNKNTATPCKPRPFYD